MFARSKLLNECSTPTVVQRRLVFGPLSAPASTSDLSTGHTTGPAHAQPKWNVPKNDSTRSSLWKLRNPRLEYSGQEDSPTLTSRTYDYRGDSPETPCSDPPAVW